MSKLKVLETMIRKIVKEEQANKIPSPGHKVMWYSPKKHAWVSGTIKRSKEMGLYSILGNDGMIYHKKLGDGFDGSFTFEK